ncbi:LCP family protein [Cellulosimicrobium sp. TH-20]|uniref:LCP family protein n=1 Tax=Cellulosimicrobium sp. TH-20 TaxID=1980001 RepID=UPI001E2EBEA5|nr:LCP family protein [Cellulosimicrobium sp. TH-20]
MPKSAPASPPARARSRATQETRSREGGTDKPTGGPHHARALRSHRVARAIGLVLTGALVFVAVGAGAVYLDLKSKITVSDVSEYVVGMPTEEPPKDPSDPFAGKALNILVMGTDYRDAENAALAGEEEGMRSDTTFIVHVSGDRTRMEVVSIPRDSLVDLPACKLPDGSMSSPRRNTMFNEAFQIGSGGVDDMDAAAGCTISSVYSLTGVPITNHVVVKMTGVIGVVDAIDGVTMCFPEPIKEDPRYGTLDLPAGEHTLDGHEAIGFLRARHGTGMGLEMGSDLTRIARQQAFIDSAVRELLSQNIITNSPQLYGVIEAVLGSISADPTIADPTALAGLAFSLRAIKPSEVVFTQVPVVDAASDRNRVEWTAEADAIWQRLIDDAPPPGHEPVTDPRDDATAPADGATDPGAGTDPGTTDPGTGAVDPGTGATDAGAGTDPGAGATEEPRDGVCA